MENIDNQIRVLSYNLCFGCMTAKYNNKTSGFNTSAQGIASKCRNISNKNSTCLKNVVKILNTLTNEPIDFIALQETSNWETLLHELENANNSTNKQKFGRYGVVYTIDKSEEMITLYDKTKYDLVAKSISNFTRGRPIHVLLCKRKNYEKYFVFINVHPMAYYSENLKMSKDWLSEKLSKAIEKEPLITSTLSSDEENFGGIIIAGDFNDQQYRPFANPEQIKYYEGIYPFTTLGDEFYKNIVAKTDGTPPDTCCKASGERLSYNNINVKMNSNNKPYNHLTNGKNSNYKIIGFTHEGSKPFFGMKGIGDYILSNLKEIKSTYVPLINNKNKTNHPYQLTSDHLPVMAVLSYEQRNKQNLSGGKKNIVKRTIKYELMTVMQLRELVKKRGKSIRKRDGSGYNTKAQLISKLKRK